MNSILMEKSLKVYRTVIKTPDDKYHIIDWKTCSWGWNMSKKQIKWSTISLPCINIFFSKA